MANYDSTHTGATIDSAVSQVTDSTTDLNIDSNTLVVDKSANSVGIGTAAPDVPLEVSVAGSGVTNVLKLTTTGSGTVPALEFEGDANETQHIIARIQAQQDDASNGGIVFQTENSGSVSERMRIDSAGDVTFTGDIIMADGKGIDFSADASPASGMTAEILDDYEEGTWTAVVTDGTNAMTMQNAAGVYTKVGNLVTVSGYFNTTSLGSASGSIRIGGLPFTIASGASAHTGGVCAYGAGYAITAGYSVTFYGGPSETHVNLVVWDRTTGTSAMQEDEWTSDGETIVDFSYRAA